jgi:hypothetical protein
MRIKKILIFFLKKLLTNCPGCDTIQSERKRKGDNKMTTINELKKRIKTAEEMMRKYPEDANLVEACKWRIEISKKEIEAQK